MTFAVGDEVRIADRAHAGHHRTPGYLKGRRARVARVHGTFTNPETRAYAADGLPRLRLYLVEVARGEIWPRADRRERLYADVFEHWLEPAR